MVGLYLTNDLFFASRVTATARAQGGELHIVPSAAALLERAAAIPCTLVLLDLDAPGADAAEVVAGLAEQAHRPQVVAFGSHVHEARLAAARQAGCDVVLTRGQFDRQMADLLRKGSRVTE